MEVAVESAPKESPEDKLPDVKPEEKIPTPPPQEPPKKSKKEDRLKKDDKSVEQFMKSLNSVPSLEEKLSLVCKKYVQTADDNKKMQFYIKQSDKRYALLSKEKEQLQHEYNKTVLVKSKLENLCRELQKQNKAIKEESLLKIREEEERRKETQGKFQSTLAEISALLQQNNEKNAKLRDDNVAMSDKFKSVVAQYQMREQQVDKMAKQMALETQLNEAKMQKANLEHQAEKGKLLTEMEELRMEAALCRARINELQGTESSLRSQIDVYTDKYDEFQNALVKSNQVFGGFKGEMDKMSKKIQKLEKESLSWKKRWETSQTALIDMCSERQAFEERAATANKHLHHMQGLCRTLQSERSLLLSTLKEHNIERPPLPPAAPAPPPPPPAPANSAKVDAMAANCVQLRQSLAHLQNQLNVLTNKNEPPKEPVPVAEPAKPDKKKAKSKKNKGAKTLDKIEEVTQNPEAAEATPKEFGPNAAQDSAEIAAASEKTMEDLTDAVNQASINLKAVEISEKIPNGKPLGNDQVVAETKEDSVVATNDSTLDNVTTSVPTVETQVATNKSTVEEVVATKESTLECVVEKCKDELNDSSFSEPGVNDEISQILEEKSLLEINEEAKS